VIDDAHRNGNIGIGVITVTYETSMKSSRCCFCTAKCRVACSSSLYLESPEKCEIEDNRLIFQRIVTKPRGRDNSKSEKVSAAIAITSIDAAKRSPSCSLEKKIEENAHHPSCIEEL
jgi:hypothetical protein